MTLPATLDQFALVDDFRTMFGLSEKGVIDGFFAEYAALRGEIEAVASYFAEVSKAQTLDYFLDGNCDQDRGRVSLKTSAKQLFDGQGAIAALNAKFWDKAVRATDVLDLMPTARRNEWYENIRQHSCPDFDETIVRATITDLLMSRAKFFAERVDGIFRGLSGAHVTNTPQGFGKRMIIANVLDRFGSSSIGSSGLIHDLRCVIAKFMGRPDPSHVVSWRLIDALKGRWGEWVDIDGGAFRVRLYKKGTAHLEVHPDMAWRLNDVLGSLHPLAIPASFRTKPAAAPKQHTLIRRPLPTEVLATLEGMEAATEPTGNFRHPYRRVPNTLEFRYGVVRSSVVTDEVRQILMGIGGVEFEPGKFRFAYNPSSVISLIVIGGMIPDERAHQFYPTPRALAEVVVEAAQIRDGHRILEPSAGTGGLADLLPKSQTTCIEVAALQATVLREKGFETVEVDFVAWSANRAADFDRIVMNPPFSEGRAVEHVFAASKLLAPGGRLVAILPSGAKNKRWMDGWSVSFSETLSNQFPGVSVEVVIMTADRPL